MGAIKTFMRWTEDEKTLLAKIGGSANSYDLAEFFPGRTRESIRAMRMRLGIPVEPSAKSEIARTNRAKLNPDDLCKLNQLSSLDDLGDLAIQVLLGSMLGDGCIRRSSGGRRNFLFYESHCWDQLEYLRWKQSVLHELGTVLSEREGKSNPEMYTCQHRMFASIRSEMYVNGGKHIIPSWFIKKLNATGLLVWYLDDGYVGTRKDGKNNRFHHVRAYPSISAQRWRIPDLERLCFALNESLGTHLKVQTSNRRDKTHHTVRIPSVDRDTLFPIWKNAFSENGIPDCMLYKIDPHENPRWNGIKKSNSQGESK